MSSVPQKVLIHHLGSLGDTAFLMPIFHHLNEVFPDAEKRVLTNFPVAAAAPPLQAVLGDGAGASTDVRGGAGASAGDCSRDEGGGEQGLSRVNRWSMDTEPSSLALRSTA